MCCTRLTGFVDIHPESVELGLCSWRTLPVPPMLQPVHSSHASSIYSTHALLARTTRTAVDAPCALFARLEPLFDACAPGTHSLYRLYRRLCSLCILCTSRALTRPVCFWRALLVPPKWIAAEKTRARLRHAVVCPNVKGRTKERIAQSKRVARTISSGRLICE